MKITWFGTASIAVEGENGRILFDPFLPLDKSDVHTDESSFRGYESILITHGHVDHISSIPCIFSGQNIYCTKTPLSTLKKDGIPEECLHLVKPGDTFTAEGFEINVLQGKHIRFDRRLIRRTLLSREFLTMRNNRRHLEREIIHCRENHETVCFLIKAEGKKIFVMGSMALSDIEYPQGPDLLILPYQGKSDLLEPALETVARLKPLCVLTDHFDNTFPPFSGNTNPYELKEALDGILPVIVPEHNIPVYI